jgi:hypothetical protein
MMMRIKQSMRMLAVGAGIAMSGMTVQAVASPFFQDHEQDYSKNKNYQQGMREGHDDQAKKRDHYKKHHFKKDEDQKAYEAGYQKGHGN